MAIAAGDAHAGASLFVDDASITPTGHCQIESWARAYSGSRELVTAPACTIAGTELTLSAGKFFHPTTRPLIGIGAKHLWRNFDEQLFGSGFSLGATWNTDSKRVDVWNFNLPVSFAFNDRRKLVLHANIGWIAVPGANDGPTAGVGIERVLTRTLTLLAELYAQHDGVHARQMGIRRTLNDNINFDLLAGHQSYLVNASWFVTLGCNIALP